MLSIIVLNVIVRQRKVKCLKYILYVLMLLFVINCNSIYQLMDKVPSLKYYAVYLKSPKNVQVSIWYFIKVVPVLLPYLLLRKQINITRKVNLASSLTIIGCILNLLAFYSFNDGERISMYFMMLQIILVPTYLEIFRKNQRNIIRLPSKKHKLELKNKISWVALNIIFLTFYTGYWYSDFCMKNRCETVPYRTIFQDNSDISNNKK